MNMPVKFMKNKNNFLIRFYNNSYNNIFKKLNNIKYDKKETISFKHFTSLSTAWLLNLNKLYNLTRKNLDLKNYHFLDVGCGNGITIIYAYKKLVFKSYSGFDLQ